MSKKSGSKKKKSKSRKSNKTVKSGKTTTSPVAVQQPNMTPVIRKPSAIMLDLIGTATKTGFLDKVQTLHHTFLVLPNSLLFE